MCHVPVTCQCKESRTTYLHYTLAGALTQRSSRFQLAIPLGLVVLPPAGASEAGGCRNPPVPGNSTVATGVDIQGNATTAAGASSAMASSMLPTPKMTSAGTTGPLHCAAVVGGSFRFRPGGIVPSRLQTCTAELHRLESVQDPCRVALDLQTCGSPTSLQVPVLTILLIKSVPADLHLQSCTNVKSSLK